MTYNAKDEKLKIHSENTDYIIYEFREFRSARNTKINTLPSVCVMQVHY